LVQAISAASNKRFRIGQQPEVGDLMAWLLHQLHVGTGGKRKPGSSIVHQIFQGKVRVTTRQAKMNAANTNSKSIDKTRKRNTNDDDEDDRLGSDDEGNLNETPLTPSAEQVLVEETTTDTHFLQLTLDIPEKPLF
jgi:U4/U6.U5 tri-snRNP-associated protein 2